MGNNEFKQGELFENITTQIRPLDAIFFRGDAIMSKVISYIGNRNKREIRATDFTHIGIVVTSDILDHVGILPNKKYILESIIGGTCAYDIQDINGRIFSGVQIRELESVINAYDKSDGTRVAFGKLIHNPIDTVPLHIIKDKFTIFFGKYGNTNYDYNPYSLASSACCCLRPCRQSVETICGTSDYYFCSEIATLLYKYFNLYSMFVNEKDVLPMDIAYAELDKDNAPKIIDVIIPITTLRHYIPKNKCHVKTIK
jgi:hypothetical protein